MSQIAARARAHHVPRLEEQTAHRILGVAAEWFADHGYAATSMRDIAGAVGLTPGALYVHFPSKGQLLLAVYGEGVARIGAAVDAAVTAAGTDPWQRLEAAACAHLSVLMARAGFARVIVKVMPDDVEEVARGLKRLRDVYEQRFVRLIEALPVQSRTSRSLVRLMLLGALNAVPGWAKTGAGRATPAQIARTYIATVRAGIAPGGRRGGAVRDAGGAP